MPLFDLLGFPFLYAATLFQAGATPPLASVGFNNFPGVLVWSYFQVGTYRLTLPPGGSLVVDKTFMWFSRGDSAQVAAMWSLRRRTTADLELETFNAAGALADGLISVPSSFVLCVLR